MVRKSNAPDVTNHVEGIIVQDQSGDSTASELDALNGWVCHTSSFEPVGAVLERFPCRSIIVQLRPMLIIIGNTTASLSTGVTLRLLKDASMMTSRIHAAETIATVLGAVQYIRMHETA
jgi:hypothetical protein